MTQIQPLAPRSALFTAFRSGGLVAARLRPSRHAPSGLALALAFGSAPAAFRFAAPRPGCFVRPVAGRQWFAVSVPVTGRDPRVAMPAETIPTRGGLRTVARIADYYQLIPA